MKTLFVDNNFDNKKIITFLEREFPFASKNVFYKALRKKDIRINGIRTSDNIIIHSGDKIDVYIKDEFLFNFDIKTIYEDENILIVNKPKNIEVTGKDSIENILCEKYKPFKIMPCHRLDRNTSGLVIFAKTEEALNILLEKFKNKEILKFYKAKVYGFFDKKHDILKAYLFKDSKRALVYISDEKKPRL